MVEYVIVNYEVVNCIFVLFSNKHFGLFQINLDCDILDTPCLIKLYGKHILKRILVIGAKRNTINRAKIFFLNLTHPRKTLAIWFLQEYVN